MIHQRKTTRRNNHRLLKEKSTISRTFKHKWQEKNHKINLEIVNSSEIGKNGYKTEEALK